MVVTFVMLPSLDHAVIRGIMFIINKKDDFGYLLVENNYQNTKYLCDNQLKEIV